MEQLKPLVQNLQMLAAQIAAIVMPPSDANGSTPAPVSTALPANIMAAISHLNTQCVSVSGIINASSLDLTAVQNAVPALQDAINGLAAAIANPSAN